MICSVLNHSYTFVWWFRVKTNIAEEDNESFTEDIISNPLHSLHHMFCLTWLSTSHRKNINPMTLVSEHPHLNCVDKPLQKRSQSRSIYRTTKIVGEDKGKGSKAIKKM